MMLGRSSDLWVGDTDYRASILGYMAYVHIDSWLNINPIPVALCSSQLLAGFLQQQLPQEEQVAVLGVEGFRCAPLVAALGPEHCMPGDAQGCVRMGGKDKTTSVPASLADETSLSCPELAGLTSPMWNQLDGHMRISTMLTQPGWVHLKLWPCCLPATPCQSHHLRLHTACGQCVRSHSQAGSALPEQAPAGARSWAC